MAGPLTYIRQGNKENRISSKMKVADSSETLVSSKLYCAISQN
jgi:hypothetical protein